MNAAQQEVALHELLDDMALEVAQGVLLKNINARLIRNGCPAAAAEKLTRAVEIKANEFMQHAAR